MQADQPTNVERPEEQARVPRLFAAIANRNYRWYWFCAGFSSISMSIGMLTQGWLVLEITNSPFWVGFVAASMGVGHVGFGLFGGVMVDRWDKRKVLIAVQALTGLVALAVALLIFAEMLVLWHMAVAAVLQGVLESARSLARARYGVITLFDEAGVLLAALGGTAAVGNDQDRVDPAETMFAFQRGCELGFEPACGNYRAMLDGGDAFERAPPTIADYPIVLRGSKGEIMDREPAALYARACRQGWADAFASLR